MYRLSRHPHHFFYSQLLAGVLVVVDGLAAGPHAFGQGWYSVGGIVIAGLLLMGAGASVLCETRRTI
ncbi:MAG: hypothetical protein ACYC61_28435 [Isosphaeraceae bacterium]